MLKQFRELTQNSIRYVHQLLFHLVLVTSRQSDLIEKKKVFSKTKQQLKYLLQVLVP